MAEDKPQIVLSGLKKVNNRSFNLGWGLLTTPEGYSIKNVAEEGGKALFTRPSPVRGGLTSLSSQITVR